MGPTGNQGPPQAQAYAAELAAQMEEKRVRMAGEREERRRGDRVDDGRVAREAGELQAEVQGEVGRQRQREANVCAREDSLTRFLAENQSSGREQPSSAPADMRRPPAGGRAPLNPPRAEGYGAPWASHEQQDMQAPARNNQKVAPSPFALCQDLPTPCRAAANQHQRSSAPYGLHDQPQQQERARAPVGGSAAPWAMHDEGGLPPRPPRAPMSMGDCGAAPRPGVSSNVFATGSNQNCGNFMTDRASSRVLKPPGGGSSLQLF